MKLTMKLATQATDQAGRAYDVTVYNEDGHWILDVTGTRAWRLASLANVGDRLALDIGTGWHLTNARALVDEATALVATAGEIHKRTELPRGCMTIAVPPRKVRP